MCDVERWVPSDGLSIVRTRTRPSPRVVRYRPDPEEGLGDVRTLSDILVIIGYDQGGEGL